MKRVCVCVCGESACAFASAFAFVCMWLVKGFQYNKKWEKDIYHSRHILS